MTTNNEQVKEGDIKLSSLNEEIFGCNYFKKLKYKRACSDIESYIYLLKHFKIKSLINFLYTKTIVPTGEGFFLGLAGKLRKYPDKVPIPRFIEMETTTVCNKKCIICEYVYWPKGEQEKRHMSLDEFKHVVNQFPVLRWANLTGEGSSFLNKDYPLMLKHLWEKHKTSIWLVEHLADISFDKLEKEVFPYINGIYVSMDGATKATYESIKIGCNFDNVINNLKKIVAYKRTWKKPFPHISFRYIIIKQNVSEIPLFVDLINSIAAPHEWGGSTSNIEFTGLLTFPEINKYYTEDIPQNIIGELLKRKEGIQFQFSHAEKEFNPLIEYCTAWMEPYIMMPGYVLPCCAVMMSNKRPFLRKYSFGNVFEKDFKDIWHNEYYTKFRQMINDPDQPVPRICVGCRAYRTEQRIKQHGIWDYHADKTE